MDQKWLWNQSWCCQNQWSVQNGTYSSALWRDRPVDHCVLPARMAEDVDALPNPQHLSASPSCLHLLVFLSRGPFGLTVWSACASGRLKVSGSSHPWKHPSANKAWKLVENTPDCSPLKWETLRCVLHCLPSVPQWYWAPVCTQGTLLRKEVQVVIHSSSVYWAPTVYQAMPP